MKSTWKMIRSPHFNHPVLVPDDTDAMEYAFKTQDGKAFVIELKSQRNPRQHKLFFSLLAFVVHHSDKYTNVEQLLQHLKIATGHVREFHGYDGKMYLEAKSISFGSMSQEKFREFFESCIDIICTRFVPTLESDALRNEFWGYLND